MYNNIPGLLSYGGVGIGIQFLDCTLRDGAHVNGGEFGSAHIRNIISSLSKASSDIVEIGFLKNVVYDEDVTSYPVIEDAEDILKQSFPKDDVTYALMARADTYDISKLSDCNGRIKLIRIAFYYDYLEKAIDFAKTVKSKGYDFTLNLINTPGSSLEELEKLIVYANEIKPYAVMIVDTFGVLDVDTMVMIANNYHKKLDPSIRLGLHAHENMSMAYSLAQQFIRTVGNERDIIIDGSLMGIGRAPGNLCTELVCNYLNERYEKGYGLSAILESISDDILPIKENHKWGYSPEYFLSARYKVHRSYAEYMSDDGMELRKINEALSKIDVQHSKKFDKDYLLKIIEENDK